MPPSIGTGSYGFGGKPGSSSSFADLFCAEVKSVSLDDCLSAAENGFPAHTYMMSSRLGKKRETMVFSFFSDFVQMYYFFIKNSSLQNIL